MDVTKVCNDINELQEPVRTQAKLLIEECKKQGLNAKIFETYRPQARQDYLYEQGRTRPGKIVTQTRSSIHTKRCAFDVIQNIAGKEYDSVFLKKVGKIGKELGLDWGGDWKDFIDNPHFENPNKRPIPERGDKIVKVNIEINGVIKEVHAIEKDGNNYIKLRDLQDDKIVIDYDSQRKMPTITTK